MTKLLQPVHPIFRSMLKDLGVTNEDGYVIEPVLSNREACDAFRRRLTHGFYVTHLNGKIAPHNGHSHKLVLTETKAWRGDVWKAFAELERRLCPTNIDGGPRTTPTHPTPIKQDT